MRFLTPSPTESVGAWKGTAHDYDVTVEGRTRQDTAWCYAAPKPVARDIEGYIAFWNGIRVWRIREEPAAAEGARRPLWLRLTSRRRNLAVA